MYIQVTTTETGKGYNPKDKWTMINEEKKSFPTMQAVKSFLKEKYGKCKRTRMYVDGKDSNPIHCGYIYSFHNSDISHVPVEKWIQQDWVSFERVEAIKLS